MTTYGQKQFEALGLLEKKHTTSVKVTSTITNHPDKLTNKELEDVTAVFRTLETGLREATIDPRDLQRGMKMLGLNPSDQALLDIPNKIGRDDGLIYFPDFCQLCLEYFRQSQDEEEEFRKNLFKEEFIRIMKALPVSVSEEEITEMFYYADSDDDGLISYDEFQVMVSPPDISPLERPHIAQLVFSPRN